MCDPLEVRGTHVQLLARGPQDAYLTAQDAASFWDPVVPRQHAPFAVEAVEERARVRFGRVARVDVPRAGDVLSDVTLEVRLPPLRDAAGAPVADAAWVPRVGYALLRRVRLLVDDLVVDDQERLWYDVADKLFAPAGRARGLDALLGAADGGVVYVPLKLACCKAHHARRAGLPLLAMYLSTLTLELHAEEFGALVQGAGAARCVPPADLDVRVLFDVVTLGADERQGMLSRPVAMEVRGQQDMDALNYVESDDGRLFRLPAVRVDLSELNLPVTFLAWVAYEEPWAELYTYLPASAVRQAVLAFSGADRFEPRAGAHFALQQRFAFARRAARGDEGVSFYSFALDAAARQPSGAANFAALTGPELRVALAPGVPARTKLKVFAETVNWLLVARGRATLRFMR